MDKKEHIPMPTAMERRAAIRRIAEEGLADTAPSWRSLPLSALVFGVEDCLFMAVLLGLLPLALLPLPAGLLAEKLSLTLFLSAPLLYAAAHLLTMWKESQCGTLDWKRTCRLSLQTLTPCGWGSSAGRRCWCACRWTCCCGISADEPCHWDGYWRCPSPACSFTRPCP